MDRGEPVLAEISVLIVLIVLNAFFAASEIALISLNDNKIKLMAEEGHRKAILLANLLREPSRFLATIQIGITLAGFMASAFAADSFADRLAAFLFTAGVPLSVPLLRSTSVVLITLVLSYFTLVLGELVPKRLAMKKAEPIAMLAARPLTILSIISSPFVKLLTFSTNVIVKAFGVDPHANDEDVTEEEIRMMVDVGEERGSIQEDEKMMINNIFDFDTKTVSDIMTHRTNIVGIPAGASFQEVIDIVNLEKYTRFPVYEHSDHITGTLHVKELVKYMEHCDENSFELREVTREPYFVPESRKIDDLFKDMQKDKVHLAIVIDEYGGTAGLVTSEDLLEEIVGNIFDEYDEEERSGIQQVDEQTFLLDGNLPLDDVEDRFRLNLPIDEYETLSGFMIGQLGRIPSAEESVTIVMDGVTFEKVEMDRKRISTVKATVTDGMDS
jgi:putative hemolysin